MSTNQSPREGWEDTAEVLRAVIDTGLLEKKTAREIAKDIAIWHHAQLHAHSDEKLKGFYRELRKEAYDYSLSPKYKRLAIPLGAVKKLLSQYLEGGK